MGSNARVERPGTAVGHAPRAHTVFAPAVHTRNASPLERAVRCHQRNLIVLRMLSASLQAAASRQEMYMVKRIVGSDVAAKCAPRK
jgi:hypothetical protein